MKLYVRRVFIMDDAEELLPPYLRFVRGVVDATTCRSTSRARSCRRSRDVEAIRDGCVKRVLDLLDELARERSKEKYATFWNEFGRVLKEGFVEDTPTAIASRSCCASPRRTTAATRRTCRSPITSARMKEGQEAIYYVTARHFARGAQQPAPRDLPQEGRRGAAAVRPRRRVGRGHLPEFEGKPLRSVAKGALDLGELARCRRKEGARGRSRGAEAVGRAFARPRSATR